MGERKIPGTKTGKKNNRGVAPCEQDKDIASKKEGVWPTEAISTIGTLHTSTVGRGGRDGIGAITSLVSDRRIIPSVPIVPRSLFQLFRGAHLLSGPICPEYRVFTQFQNRI